MSGATPIFRPEPLKLSRRLKASRELVFKAWSDADHVRRWFAPEGCEAVEAEVDFRPGGVFNVTMQIPGGARHEMRGHFTLIEAPERLGFAGEVHSGGKLGFRFDTLVALTPDVGGAKVDVTQTYEIYDETFRSATEGAREGWGSTLGNLEREASTLRDASPRSAAHGAFTLQRAFAVSPARLFQAFADPQAKARWFAGPPGFELHERSMDVRVGGRETLSGRHANGVVTQFEAVYFDVVPGERLIYTYEMRLDDRKISVSLATATFAADPKGSLLTLTEQGVFLDGYDDNGMREMGSGFLLDALDRALSAG